MSDEDRELMREMGKDSEPVETKQNFNGGYIKASQEAYDLLIEGGYERESHTNELQKYICIDNNRITYVVKEFLNSFPHKQFYINNGVLSWEEPKGWSDKMEWTEPPILKDCEPTSANNAQVEINNMEDLDGLPIVGEELRVTVTTSNPEIGDIVTKTSVFDGNPINVTANETVTITKPIKSKDFIKPKWFEDESNFPALMVVGRVKDEKIWWICEEQVEYMRFIDEYKVYRLATEEEVNSLYFDGKE